MRPLDALERLDPPSRAAVLLSSAPPAEVRAELARLGALDLGNAAAAARDYARGSLALREGQLDEAVAHFEPAVSGFEAAGEREAAGLARCELWLTRIRRGPRKEHAAAVEALAAVATAHADSRLVVVTATHYRGTALRHAGETEATLRVLLEALAASDGLLMERARVLNSLGTLYVLLGAFGAARAVLEHAADINHRIGDAVSEAISFGQLGSAALALGELTEARRYLQKQEWLASRVCDNFGRARALVLLADLAIDLQRPDDAVLLAEQARTVAASVQPVLGMWIAYASRSIGRAQLDMGDRAGLVELRAARERFAAIGNQLGEALVRWDLARQAGDADGGEPPALGEWASAAWAFGSLGLTNRVAQLLADLRGRFPAGERRQAIDQALGATAQAYPHLSAAHEVELVYREPDTLGTMAQRRIEGQRNLGRLAALTLAEPGLHVAAVVSAAIGDAVRALPSARSAAACAARLPSMALWCWRASSSATEIARDLSSLSAACGGDARGALGWYPAARVHDTPLAGEPGASLRAVDVPALIAEAVAATTGSLRRAADVPWDGEAEALLRMSGLASVVAGGP